LPLILHTGDLLVKVARMPFFAGGRFLYAIDSGRIAAQTGL
jgi:hypothetical protein